jgi:hypothetical protein
MGHINRYQREHNLLMSRRTALYQITNTMIATVGICKASLGEKKSITAGPVRLEQQSTGSEICQVTTEQFEQSNIYCEIPYCSRDSRYFVYERKNPRLKGRNKTELVVVEIGTWKQHLLDVYYY